MTRGLRIAVCLVGLLLCTSCPAQVSASPGKPVAPPTEQDAAGAAPTLRITTRTVEISAVVHNKTGEPQGALTKDDFDLKVDGREQPIRYFSVASDLPLTLALLVDVSGSQRTFIGDEWRASDLFFESMLTRPQDRAMLVEIDSRVDQLMGLTSSPSALHLALTQLGNATDVRAASTRLNDAIYMVAKGLGAQRTGRKAIVLLSDGGENSSRATAEQAIEQAQRANVAIYSVVYSAWVPPDMMSTAGMAGWTPPHYVNGGEKLMEHLAQATGGHVYTVGRGTPLRKIYESISNDLRTQYQLGYTPPPDLQPNSFHKLDLRPKDKKLTVQARSGFYVQP